MSSNFRFLLSNTKKQTLMSMLKVNVRFTQKLLEIWNRIIKVPKIAPELLFPISGMNFSVQMLIFSFFCINQINLSKAGTTM